MAVKSDRWIRDQALNHGMIEPFTEQQVRSNQDGQRIISYGLSSYGYDVTCAPEFKVFTNIHSAVVDPKTFTMIVWLIVTVISVSFHRIHFLARTNEYFKIPRNVLVICLGKSTYARCGIIVNVTPFGLSGKGILRLSFLIQPTCLRLFIQ